MCCPKWHWALYWHQAYCCAVLNATQEFLTMFLRVLTCRESNSFLMGRLAHPRVYCLFFPAFCRCRGPSTSQSALPAFSLVACCYHCCNVASLLPLPPWCFWQPRPLTLCVLLLVPAAAQVSACTACIFVSFWPPVPYSQPRVAFHTQPNSPLQLSLPALSHLLAQCPTNERFHQIDRPV